MRDLSLAFPGVNRDTASGTGAMGREVSMDLSTTTAATGRFLSASLPFAIASEVQFQGIAAVGAAFAVATLVAVLVYIRRLNKNHARLLGAIESELTSRRHVEAALRASEGFYHSLVESLPASILRKDVDGKFTFVNQKFYAALGVQSSTQIVGKTDHDFFPAELAEKYREDDRYVMTSGKILEAVEDHVTRNGEQLSVQVVKTPLHDASGAVIGVQGIFWDVTERKRAEEQLRLQNVKLHEMAVSEREAHAAMKQAQSQLVQSEKLASLGQIVAGVAHEINNPVAFVTNNVAVLGRDVSEMRELLELYAEADPLIEAENPELAERVASFRERVDMAYTLTNIQGLLARSRDGLRRIQQIVSHLRLFAHLDGGELSEADLNDGVESTVAIIVGHARKKQINLTVETESVPPVTCNVARINQVILNLLTNSIDACAEGGRVTVRTRRDGDFAVLEVADDGCGIPSEVRDRIFDPFFTTKAIGEGTGLGLSISYGIVKDHGGTIAVDSAPGQGACFRVRLPFRPPGRGGSLSSRSAEARPSTVPPS